MPFDAFFAETLDKLATATQEVVVSAAQPLRDNVGPNEYAFVDQFNLSLKDNPIPVA
jgi:uncharacterized oxidoreductase